MELDKIKVLLDKYFDGNTSIIEEEKINSYFSSNEINEELKVYQPMFQSFEKNKKKVFSKEIPKVKDSYNFRMLLVAASLTLLVSIGVLSKNSYDNYVLNKNLEHVKSALNQVSINMQKGNYAVKELKKINNLLNK